MNELTRADRDRLATAHADALDRHLRYMAQEQAKQTTIIQDCQPGTGDVK